jgi:hypothetical protein
MRNVFIGLIVCMGAFQASAKTHYQTLGDAYKTSKRPSISKISHVAWSGRCFARNDQNTPTNAGYVFRKKRASDAYEAKSYMMLNAAPNFFDDKSLEYVLENFRTAVPFTRVRILEKSIELKMDAETVSRLRQSPDYLIEEIISTDEDSGPVAKPVVDMRCYYFIAEAFDNE